MDPAWFTAVGALIFTVLGLFLALFTRLVDRQRPGLDLKGGPTGTKRAKRRPPHPQSGRIVLLAFTALVLIFAVVTVVTYWEVIASNIDNVYFLVWLFFAMVGGIFAQVLVNNYRHGLPLLSVSASELVFPLLLAPIIFYSVWAVASSAPQTAFAFYSAFVNGFFWENVVASVKGPIVSNEPDHG